MPIIRQESLFDMQVLYDLEPTQRINSILSGIDIHPILDVVMKKSRFGAPQKLNYSAMIYSLIIRITDRILHLAMSEGFVSDETVAIDATHVQARDRAPVKKDQVEKEPKKRGRKKKEEREQWLLEKAEEEANLPLYEKTIAAQLDVPLSELRSTVPISPEWGVKKNSEGKNVFWYGFKCHLAVGTKSQYILQSLFSSGNLNDDKAAIPLLKGIRERLPSLKMAYATMDAGYDYMPIYQHVYRMKVQSIIAYNKKNEPEPLGVDKYFTPTCVREHSLFK